MKETVKLVKEGASPARVEAGGEAEAHFRALGYTTEAEVVAVAAEAEQPPVAEIAEPRPRGRGKR